MDLFFVKDVVVTYLVGDMNPFVMVDCVLVVNSRTTSDDEDTFIFWMRD